MDSQSLKKIIASFSCCCVKISSGHVWNCIMELFGMNSDHDCSQVIIIFYHNQHNKFLLKILKIYLILIAIKLIQRVSHIIIII